MVRGPLIAARSRVHTPGTDIRITNCATILLNNGLWWAEGPAPKQPKITLSNGRKERQDWPAVIRARRTRPCNRFYIRPPLHDKPQLLSPAFPSLMRWNWTDKLLLFATFLCHNLKKNKTTPNNIRGTYNWSQLWPVYNERYGRYNINTGNEFIKHRGCQWNLDEAYYEKCIGNENGPMQRDLFLSCAVLRFVISRRDTHKPIERWKERFFENPALSRIINLWRFRDDCANWGVTCDLLRACPPNWRLFCI